MLSYFRPLRGLVSVSVWLLITSFSHADQSDVECLRSIKNSFEDPNGYLASWDFNDNTPGFICAFSGIGCWHEYENRVFSLRLADMGLKGEFQLGVSGCSTVMRIDLSSNNINGNIPNNISLIIGYVTLLNLSSNNLSGEIPVNLSNCSHLNVLALDDNQLTGQIPPEIGRLSQIKTFTVTGNRLSGPVPNFINGNVSAESYANNAGLCGGPLPSCVAPSKKIRAAVIVGAAVGAIFGALGLFVVIFFNSCKVSRNKKERNKGAKSIKGAKRIKLLMFEKAISKMNLSDLMKATGDFNKKNIITWGRAGAMYKATLEDGTSLMVKRLQDSKQSKKKFMSEMATLGNMKHRNLVPLLGYCMTKKERFLVHKYMPNGTLHNKLHNANDGGNAMDWPLRLEIGIRAANGFAWLHHSCNPPIIHQNISSKCILLDEDYEPKISDFGLARLMKPIDTNLRIFINGELRNLGYVAPEYTRTLVATPKGDVYSFGVVLLELVTGEKPTFVSKVSESFKGNLVEWISQLSGTSRLHDAIDESLVGKGFDSELFQFLKVARSCVLPEHNDRPTMFEVYQLLRAIGQRYDFKIEDDVLVLPHSGDDNQLVELIVDQKV